MTRVDLGDGQWMALRDDLTLTDMQKIAKSSNVYHPEYDQWRVDPLEAAIESVRIVVEEWAVLDAAGNPLQPTPDALRGLPIKRGMTIIRAISEHIKNQGLTQEDLAGGSET